MARVDSLPRSQQPLPPPLRASPSIAGRAEPSPFAPTAAAPLLPAALPYSAGVAARFPDPAVSYRTPAFEPGRVDFTTDAELQTLLRGWVRDGSQNSSAVTIRLLSVGVSQEGVPIEALLYTRSLNSSLEGVLADKRPTVVLLGQQHGDEPASSEALLVIAERLAGGSFQGVLDRINVIVVPRANPDGARRGSRVSAGGIDVNRDHLLLKSPEAVALARLVRNYRPAVVVDAHEYTVGGRYLEKFGTIQRFDALLQYAMTGNVPEFVTRAAEEWFREPLVAALERENLTSEWYYTTSTDIADKKVSMGGTQPDTGRNVNGLKNAVSLLIETRGVGIGRTHLLRRVHTHVIAATSVLNSAAKRAPDLVKLRQYVDAEVAALACRGQAVIEAATTPSEYSLLMLDPATGADRSVSVAWDSSLVLVPTKTRARPCGYWLAADQTDAVQRLRELGLKVHQVVELGVMRGEAYRETARESGARQDVRGAIDDRAPIERVSVALSPMLIDAAAGSYYVPLGQPLANLALAALEPDTQNSYYANGIVNRLAAIARVTAQPDAKLFVAP